MVDSPLPGLCSFMKHHKLPQDLKQNPAGASRPVVAEELKQNVVDFVLSPDEVARKAYFSYLNEGSLPGHDVEHWLTAEAQLIAERNLTRVHGFHNRT